MPFARVGLRSTAAVLVATTLACGGDAQPEGAGSGADAPAAPGFDACAILSNVDAAAIFGGPADAPIPAVQNLSGPVAVSQCVVGASSGEGNLSLLLRHSSTESAPVTREELMDGERAADVLGMGEESAAALAEADVVSGVGDLALFYDMLGHNLLVFWKQHSMMIVTVNIPDRDRAREHARSIAEQVLSTY